MAEGQPNSAEKPPIGDTIAARAALLDFYGDYSVSFSSQFVASFFGLITACALINAILCFFINNPVTNVFSTLTITFSVVIFVGLGLVSWHTYNRFKYYSDLASLIAGSPLCLRNAARLDEIYIEIKIPNNKKAIKQLERFYLEIKEELPENYKTNITKFQKLKVTFPMYEKIGRYHQNKQIVKRVLNSRFFPVVLSLGLVCLCFVTYYPLLASI